MSWKDRIICNMLKRFISRKKTSSCDPLEIALIQSLGSMQDWTDKENIRQIIDWVKNY